MAALLHNTIAEENTATGAFALNSNTEGDFNTANGAFALASNTFGGNNTAVGDNALQLNTAGSNNTAIGSQTLLQNTTGSGNIALGRGSGNAVTTANNVICIGAFGANSSDSCFIGNIFGATSAGGSAVFINSVGRLGVSTSSRRFKEGITPMEAASEAVFSLEPVTFRYKKEIDAVGTTQFGLVAEDVEKVNPNLVVRDKEGKPYSVRYEAVNAMLLNEFLKEHRKNEEQEATICELKSTVVKQDVTILQQQKRMEAATIRLNEQAAQIQKVSAQLEAIKPAPQVVNNP